MTREDDDTFGYTADFDVDPDVAESDGFQEYDDEDQYADDIALVGKSVLPDGSSAFVPSADPHGSGRDRNTGSFQTFANLLKSFIGSGILGLPHAFKEGGLLASLVMMIGVGIIAAASNLMLVRCKQRLAHRGVVSYSDVGIYTYGRAMGHVLDFLLVFTQLGFCCVYLVFVADNLAGFVSVSRNILLLALTPIFVMLSYLRTLAWISPFSLAANVALISGMCIILVAAGQQMMSNRHELGAPGPQIEWLVKWRTLPVTFGMSVYAYEGIGVILPSETAMKDPAGFPKIVMLVMAIAGVMYITFGATCYLAFGEVVSDEILENMEVFAASAGGVWEGLVDAVRVCLIFTIAATFPVQLFVVTDILEQEYLLKHPKFGKGWVRLKCNALRTCLVLFCVFIAWAVPNFGPLVGLVGAFGSAALQFIVPPLIYLKLFPNMSRGRRAACVTFVLIGAIGGTLGTIDSVSQLLKQG